MKLVSFVNLHNFSTKYEFISKASFLLLLHSFELDNATVLIIWVGFSFVIMFFKDAKFVIKLPISITSLS